MKSEHNHLKHYFVAKVCLESDNSGADKGAKPGDTWLVSDFFCDLMLFFYGHGHLTHCSFIFIAM